MNFIDDHAWMRLLELQLNDFGLRRTSIFICLVLIIGTRDYFFDPLSNPDNLSGIILKIPYRNLFTTVSGWWWNSKKRQGFLNRPMARDVSNFSTIGNSIIFLVQIIRGYGCVVRFLVQICESDHVYKADAMKKLEENFKEKILRKVFIYFHTFPDQKVHNL